MAITEAQQFGENLLKNSRKISMNPMRKGSKNLKWRVIKQVNRYDKKLDKAIVDTVFSLTPPDKNAPHSFSMKGFRLENGNYVLVRLMAVYNQKNLPRYNESPKAALFREEIAKEYGQLDYACYVHSVLKKFKLI